MHDYLTRLRLRLSTDLRHALKARNAVAVSALRSLLAALDNASAVPVIGAHAPTIGRAGDVPRRQITEDDCEAILRREADALSAAASEYERLGRPEESARNRAELAVVFRYVSLRTVDSSDQGVDNAAT